MRFFSFIFILALFASVTVVAEHGRHNVATTDNAVGASCCATQDDATGEADEEMCTCCCATMEEGGCAMGAETGTAVNDGDSNNGNRWGTMKCCKECKKCCKEMDRAARDNGPALR
jgi:hypothetical protein